MHFQSAYLFHDATGRIVAVNPDLDSHNRAMTLQLKHRCFAGRCVPGIIVDAYLRQFGGKRVTDRGIQHIIAAKSEAPVSPLERTQVA